METESGTIKVDMDLFSDCLSRCSALQSVCSSLYTNVEAYSKYMALGTDSAIYKGGADESWQSYIDTLYECIGKLQDDLKTLYKFINLCKDTSECECDDFEKSMQDLSAININSEK